MTLEPMTAAQAGRVSALLKAMADPVRLQLPSLVASAEGGQACVCDLAEAFDLSQPTISHHLKVLHQSGGPWPNWSPRQDCCWLSSGPPAPGART